jgi:hypothetical protein
MNEYNQIITFISNVEPYIYRNDQFELLPDK